MNIKTMKIIIAVLVGITACLITRTLTTELSSLKAKVTYWAVFKDSDRPTLAVFEDSNWPALKVTNMIVIPIVEPNDVPDMWPEYVAEVQINFPLIKGCRLILRSRPFLLTDNPALQGKHGNRTVYHVPRPGQ